MITGKVTSVYGPDINTDDIIPAMYLQQSTDRAFFAEYAFVKFDEEFRERCRRADANIIVAGENFGCGSSREQAVYALSFNNVVCVIAPSFPDIFHRNCLTNGLTLIALDDVSAFSLGDELAVDLAKGVIENRTRGERIPFEMNDHVREIFMQGGMVGRVRSHLEEILTAR
ncbi:MAG: 3-isopropylmalate dehydratase small subunit [Gammaproteobacteria bacterium]|nr:3-isopropylmalate dehydratase small subunit [Gammaproteobacteria bacterium]